MTGRSPSADRDPCLLWQSSELAVDAVQILPAEEAYDFEHVARRLLNPGLLRQAVALAVFRLPLLAVPVGEGRRGGRAVVEYEDVGVAMAAALRGRAGFPCVRTRLTSRGFAVEWGDTAPDGADSAERERFYGSPRLPRLPMTRSTEPSRPTPRGKLRDLFCRRDSCPGLRPVHSWAVQPGMAAAKPLAMPSHDRCPPWRAARMPAPCWRCPERPGCGLPPNRNRDAARPWLVPH